MVTHVDSDASYLVLPKARSRIAGYFCLLHSQTSPHRHHVDNGPILIECKTLRSVVTSAAEAETHGVFHYAKRTIPIIHTLTQMNHLQDGPTPLRTDNSTSHGFVHNNIQMKKSKSWDMELHWLRDKKITKFIKVFWDKGTNNGGDYFTKHHATSRHWHIWQQRKYIRDTHTDLKHKINSIFLKM